MDYIVWKDLGPLTRLVMNQLHYLGLLFMIVAYSYKIYQIFQYPSAKEGTPPRGDHQKAIRYSYMTLAMPWELDTQKHHMYRYVEFALFHIAMAVGIGFAFILPMAHEFMKNSFIIGFSKLFFVLGFLIGISRLARRVYSPAMRRISTLDDYFCLMLLTLWMFSGILAAPLKSELFLFAYYFFATFFLFYVPFSKISHYVYFFFIKYYVGKHFGHRGTFPKKGSMPTVKNV
ncbi:MAG: hypothetical protein GXP53_00250 [Deltaproteobacteria bacterium]|nr:hypothetical protein [Deltaproteobacteria bacterium]